MNNLEVFIVEEQSNDRIDKFLAQEMEMYSRSYIQKLLKDGLVSVNGIIVKANYKVSPDDRIEVQIPELQEPDIVPEDIPLDILYEDEDILIVNKPKGMVVSILQPDIIAIRLSMLFFITAREIYPGLME